jgi:manganese/zinc/iron transport system permease protein
MFEVFYDPVLRAPTLGSMLMCFGASLVGVIAFLRKSSLIGESLSHAAYPGVMLGVMAAGFFGVLDLWEGFASLLVLFFAFLTAILGLFLIDLLQKRKVPTDAALCLVLSSFFGIGVLGASRLQFTHSVLYQQALGYLYGQAATMTDRHIVLYGVLAALVLACVIFFFRELQILSFDRHFAKSMGVSVAKIEGMIFFLMALSVVTGIRSVGVVLMSAMLIAPAAFARQWTHHFSTMLVLAALCGVVSAYLGNVLASHLPTGPMIVLIASIFCLFSLLFAPERGLLSRMFRRAAFRFRCLQENLLKAMWRGGEPVSLKELSKSKNISSPYLFILLFTLIQAGWVEKSKEGYFLTPDGLKRGSRIVRLHRLWELYLVDYLGVEEKRVHRNAEEMEHILTPEIEEKLTHLLKDPKVDPHSQPIPPREGY